MPRYYVTYARIGGQARKIALYDDYEAAMSFATSGNARMCTHYGVFAVETLE